MSTALPRAPSSPFSLALTTLGGHSPPRLSTMHKSTPPRLSSTMGIMANTVSSCATKFLSPAETQILATLSTPWVRQSLFQFHVVFCVQTLLSAIRAVHLYVLQFIPSGQLVTLLRSSGVPRSVKRGKCFVMTTVSTQSYITTDLRFVGGYRH